MRNIISDKEALELMKLYGARLTKCISGGLKNVATILNNSNDFENLVEYANTTKCWVVLDIIKSQIKHEFREDENVKFGEYGRGVFGLVIENKLFIRFNKMRNKGLSSFKSASKTMQAYLKQQRIPNFPDLPTLSFALYVVDSMWIELKGLHITCPNGSAYSWDIELTKNSVINQTNLFEGSNTENETITPAKTRTKVRKRETDIGKTGSDNL